MVKPSLENCKVDGSSLVVSGNWLSLINIHYTDAYGDPRIWEGVRRVKGDDFTGDSKVINACNVIPIIKNTDGTKQLLLVRQFRAAAGRQSIEFPSGLIDAGEQADICAIRELVEETGLHGRVIEKAPLPVAYTPTNSNSLGQYYIVEVDMADERNKNAKPSFDPGEYCENVLVDFDTLTEDLAKLSSKGCYVHESVLMFSFGLQTAGRI
ncbi:ADP-sugar pyrophosphatase [Carpediemonas membranifera]|uniref:ADP-sugar pyrophosphatase n=1 Tax=Carpediemonas membranifera TaxID=201153 RepID=A0A8J6B3J0_9EUKA|nr:ADP-sugar pyrophosphatase [Carpediemonas membranifera]|eukprot:KAG9392192.1 ADP-sugar pyrophosphatase [Carpediemonas membranifera]